MKKFKLYTHIGWVKYAWESVNDSLHMEWDIKRCYYGDLHPPPGHDEKVFYTDSELVHALNHDCSTKIAFMLESRYITPGYYRFLEDNIDTFDTVLSHDEALVNKYPGKCIFYPHGNCVIRQDDFSIYEKSRLVSFISSNKKMNVSGHHLRHAIYRFSTDEGGYWRELLPDQVHLDLFGSIAGHYIDYKLDSLRDYMFQIVVENSIVDTYFTEKIIDCFVSGTIPIYYGTRNVDRFFDPAGIIHFSTAEELFQILGDLNADAYHDRMEAVVTNFEQARQYIVAEDWIFENTNVFQ